jgi:MYXO-CTERM domain-containing protein
MTVLIVDLSTLAVIAKPGSGPVATFEINIDKGVVEGDHIIQLYDCVMSDAAGEALTLESTTSGTLTVEAAAGDDGSTDTGSADDGGDEGGSDTGVGDGDGGDGDGGDQGDGGADTGTADDGNMDAPIPGDKDGCSCASASAPTMGLGWLAVGLLGLLHRRERAS